MSEKVLTNHVRLVPPFIATVVILACGLNTTSLSQLFPASETSPEPTRTTEQFAIVPTSAGSGLNTLQSYRANLIVDFSGRRNGEATAGHIESLTEITRQPAALHRYLNIEGDIPKAKIAPGISEFYRANDQVYLKKAGDSLWSRFTDGDMSPGHLGFFELERLITLPVIVSTPPLTETLNGLGVHHYTFSEADLNSPNIVFDKAQGDLWIATAGDYLVQYVISTSLRIVVPDTRSHIFDEGTMTLRYALTDINADFTITLPAQADAGKNTVSNLPLLPDAEIISVFPTLIEYTSALSPVSATLFYRDELSALEWTEGNAAIFEEKARLTFSKEDQTVTVLITPAEDGQKIKVLLETD